MKVRVKAMCLMLGLLSGSCASYTFLSVQDQESIIKAQQKKTYFLKQSFFVGPFFSYDDRYYISERDFDERVLLQSPGGDPIFPAKPTGVLAMGTKVSIRQIEFPTSGAVASRSLKSPRFFTWVLLDAEGQASEKPLILVLTPEFKTIEQFERAMKDYLVTTDPRVEFGSRPAEELAAIDQKRLIKGMHVESLLRSRGHPDRVNRQFEKGVKVERWQYAAKRVVMLREDLVDSWEGFPDFSAGSPAQTTPAIPPAEVPPAPAS